MWSNCFLQYPKEEEKLIYINNSEAKKENAGVDHEFSEKLFFFTELCDGFYLLDLSYVLEYLTFVSSFFFTHN